MKAITIRQPWASMILWGLKRIETRDRHWPWSRHRGWLAIHAGATLDDEWERRIRGEAAELYARTEVESPRLGVVVGVAYHAGTYLLDWHDPQACCDCEGLWGLLLVGRLPLDEPVPATGRLGLWDLPEDVAERVRRQIREDYDVCIP